MTAIRIAGGTRAARAPTRQATRPKDRVEGVRLDAALTRFHESVRPLPGILSPERRSAFLEQVLESIHRIQFVERGILNRRGEPRSLDPRRLDPGSDLFDPLKGAAIRARAGEFDEACWLVFYFANFGKNLRTGYRLARDIYGRLGNGSHWNWANTSANPEGFRTWLGTHQHTLESDGTPRHFGNHRKFQTLKPNHRNGTGQAVVTYVNWVTAHGSHSGLFAHATSVVGPDRRRLFHYLYRSMDAVASFGRLVRFDYLTMLAKLRLLDIEPGSTYMTGATGPLDGAKLLFGNAASDEKPRVIDRWLVQLEAALSIPMGMQVLEDSLCNWQKSPDRFLPFRG